MKEVHRGLVCLFHLLIFCLLVEFSLKGKMDQPQLVLRAYMQFREILLSNGEDSTS